MISIVVESNTSSGRFRKGSLTMGLAMKCDLAMDNSSTHKHKKVNNRFKKQLGSNNDSSGRSLLPFLYITFTENSPPHYRRVNLEQESGYYFRKKKHSRPLYLAYFIKSSISLKTSVRVGAEDLITFSEPTQSFESIPL